MAGCMALPATVITQGTPYLVAPCSASEGSGQRYPLDLERIFVAGFSNGGQLTLRLARPAPDVHRGFFAVAITLCEELPRNCHPSVARRVALYKGTAGAYAADGRFIGGEATLATFSAIAGCSGMKAKPWQPDQRVARPNVIVYRAIGCPDHLDFVLFETKDRLHAWPGGMPDAPTMATRLKTQEQLDANKEIWHFLGRDASHREAQVSQTIDPMQ